MPPVTKEQFDAALCVLNTVGTVHATGEALALRKQAMALVKAYLPALSAPPSSIDDWGLGKFTCAADMAGTATSAPKMKCDAEPRPAPLWGQPEARCGSLKRPEATKDFQVGEEVVYVGHGIQIMTVTKVDGEFINCAWDIPPDPANTSSATAYCEQMFLRKDLHRKSTHRSEPQYLTAMKKAEELRLKHNGIAAVYLYLGHDGDNLCELKGPDGTSVGKANSGRTLLEAIERAEADWRQRRAAKAALRDPRAEKCTLTVTAPAEAPTVPDSPSDLRQRSEDARY